MPTPPCTGTPLPSTPPWETPGPAGPSGAACGTNCRGLVKHVEIVGTAVQGQNFLATRREGDTQGDLQPWLFESGKMGTTYGTKARFEITGEQYQPLDETAVCENCMMIQLVEGYRRLENPEEVQYDNEGVFVVDGRERTGEYDFLETNVVYDHGQWFVQDDPHSFVKPGQTIDWKEHYVTLIYEKCAQSAFESLYGVGSSMASLNELDFLDEFFVKSVIWDLKGTWTHPLDYNEIRL